MSWIERVKANVFTVSEEHSDIRKALREWAYLGNCYDPESAEADCELCDHPHIRYRFEIVNRLNGNELLIGSECIRRFSDDMVVVAESGVRLFGEKARQKVSRDKGRLIAEGKERYVIRMLVVLGQHDTEFDVDSFVSYVQERHAFTPRQVLLLMTCFQRFGIKVNKSAFQVIMRRNREKDKLWDMTTDRLRIIWHCLSPRQKTYVTSIVARRGELKVQKR